MKELPRTYWCHLDEAAPGTVRTPLSGGTTTASGEAVQWVRDSVRTVAPLLGREDFHTVWGWLGDHPAADAAVIALRQGQPYTFTTATPGDGRLRWTVYPVTVLPLADTGCLPPPAPSHTSPVSHPGTTWSTA
ncbi:hypothetical protein [Streptomyces jumonjinensis]|uniref:hypothetical protein n=1 Tax=Streptomyces jumonjinensis TaxID=1945 RepID=UPI001294B2AC|nr:hypothetical protein [Streptomyces jumonjinensis]